MAHHALQPAPAPSQMELQVDLLASCCWGLSMHGGVGRAHRLLQGHIVTLPRGFSGEGPCPGSSF